MDVSGNAAERGVERRPQPLPRGLAPYLAEVRRGMPLFGEVAARRKPGGNGHERDVTLPGLLGSLAQGLEAPQ